MNHWLQQATAHAKPIKAPSTHPASHKRKPSQRGKALTRVRELVKRQPVNTWFSAVDVFDGTVCSEDYVREILKGMAGRGELETSFMLHESRNKWMFKRIDNK